MEMTKTEDDLLYALKLYDEKKDIQMEMDILFT